MLSTARSPNEEVLPANCGVTGPLHKNSPSLLTTTAKRLSNTLSLPVTMARAAKSFPSGDFAVLKSGQNFGLADAVTVFSSLKVKDRDRFPRSARVNTILSPLPGRLS